MTFQPDVSEEFVDELFAYIDSGDDSEEPGASWERLVVFGKLRHKKAEQTEEALNRLMDRGRVFEPVLGRFVVT